MCKITLHDLLVRNFTAYKLSLVPSLLMNSYVGNFHFPWLHFLQVKFPLTLAAFVAQFYLGWHGTLWTGLQPRLLSAFWLVHHMSSEAIRYVTDLIIACWQVTVTINLTSLVTFGKASIFFFFIYLVHLTLSFYCIFAMNSFDIASILKKKKKAWCFRFNFFFLLKCLKWIYPTRQMSDLYINS